MSDEEIYGVRPEGDPELIAAGWTRRFVADAQRAREAVEMYTNLGLEVRAEPIRNTELAETCAGCRLVVELQFKAIYTRPRSL